MSTTLHVKRVRRRRRIKILSDLHIGLSPPISIPAAPQVQQATVIPDPLDVNNLAALSGTIGALTTSSTSTGYLTVNNSLIVNSPSSFIYPISANAVNASSISSTGPISSTTSLAAPSGTVTNLSSSTSSIGSATATSLSTTGNISAANLTIYGNTSTSNLTVSHSTIDSITASSVNTSSLAANQITGLQNITGCVKTNYGRYGVVDAEVYPYTNIWDPLPNNSLNYEDGDLSNAFKLPSASSYPGAMIIINSNHSSFYVKAGPNNPDIYHTTRSTVSESEGIYAVYITVVNSFSVPAGRSVVFVSNGHAWHNINLTHIS